LRSFDPVLCCYKQLKIVELENNLIPSLPVKINQMNLTQLDVSHNRLTDLPATIFQGNVSNTLVKIDLSKNKVRYMNDTLLHIEFYAIFYNPYS